MVTRASLVPLWVIGVPIVLTTLYVYLVPLPPPRFGWVIILGAVLIGAFGLLIAPMRWTRRTLIASGYIPVMLVVQLLWALGLGCAVRGTCI